MELQWGLDGRLDKYETLMCMKKYIAIHTSTWCGEHHVRCYIHIATKHIECSSDCDCVGAEFFKTSE